MNHTEHQHSLFSECIENEEYLTTQIITYIGNKRALLDFIGEALNKVKKKLNTDKLDIVDLFSGSGIVSRYFKQHSRHLIANDLEGYSYVINKCYLSNKSEINFDEINKWYNYLVDEIDKNNLKSGFISEMYAPKQIDHINIDERVFFTPRNAKFIDTVRQLINDIPLEYQCFFIAPLISEASIKNNTSGVFKGFYKNSKTGIGQYGGNNRDALSRIKRNIELKYPVFSNFECSVEVFKKDANDFAKNMAPADLVYIDPPYNQHPYGSNYFMLNLINEYIRPSEVSNVSGIPTDWNRSAYNKKQKSKIAFSELCNNLNAKYLLISFNSEGFITKDEMISILSNIGKVEHMEKKYYTFRGSRNLNNRNIHVHEYLFLVEKYNDK